MISIIDQIVKKGNHLVVIFQTQLPFLKDAILPVNFRSKDDLSMRTRLVWSASSFSSVIVGGVNAFAQPCFLTK